MIDGSVSFTKSLRDKSQPVQSRVDLAHDLIDSRINVIVPRKYAVLLEWVFDTLPQAPAERSLWELLGQLWIRVDSVTQQRLYKNHKFVVNLTQALQTQPSFVSVLASTAELLSQTTNLFGLVTDFQVSQLVLAYLAQPNRKLGAIIFKGAVHKNLFSKANTEDLALILKEPVDEYRRQYLIAYFRAGNPVAEIEGDVSPVVSAICDAQTNVEANILALLRSNQQKASQILHETVQPFVTAQLLKEVLQITETNWDVITLCLERSPVSILDDAPNLVARDPPENVLCLLLVKLAEQRRLYDFLQTWAPKKSTPAVCNALGEALTMLSSQQLAEILETKRPAWQLIIDSMSYQTAHSVRNVLLDLEEPLLRISELVPGFEFSPVSPELKLRKMELTGDGCKLKLDTDLDRLVLRFFPSLGICAVDLDKILKKCLPETRRRLATSAVALEHAKVMAAVINVAVANEELETLKLIPKQVYTWPQRHAAVEVALKHEFSATGAFVAEMIDFQHLPHPRELAQFVTTAKPAYARTLLDLCNILRKDAQYIKQFRAQILDWQQELLSCYIDHDASLAWMQEHYTDEALAEPIILGLKFLPVQPEFTGQLALQCIGTPHFTNDLFDLIVPLYKWPVVCAVFVATGHAFGATFGEYVKKLPANEQNALVLTAVAERQYALLQTLAQHHLLESHDRAISFSIIEGTMSREGSTEFWTFVDAVLREQRLLSQFSIESVLLHVHLADWDLGVRVVSRILLFNRYAIRNRFHLVVGVLTRLLASVKTPHMADGFTRLVDNFVNPGQAITRSGLSSQVARERRKVARVAGVLLQNIVQLVLAKSNELAEWSKVSASLRPAAYLLVDLVHNEGLRAVSAGMDNAGRAYLRKIFDDYKLVAWNGD